MAIHVTRAGVGLTVGIIIIAGLITGGFFLVRHQSEIARRDAATKIVAERQASEAGRDKTVALNDATEVPSSTDKTGTTSDHAPARDTANTATTTAPVTELPETGVGSFLAVVVLGALAYSMVAYVRSCRALAVRTR